MWFSLAVRLILSAIEEATKNKKKRAELRTRLLEIRDAINELYDSSPDTEREGANLRPY